MAFVKLDTCILDSTLWVERECREIFITALLLAEPIELRESTPQLEVREIKETGFVVPPGWYGMVRAAGVGIARRAMVDEEVARTALEKLGAPDPESRSEDFGGRRLVRVDGGFIVLNFMKYRDRDHSAAERQQRYRDRKKAAPLQRDVALRDRNITQADADADADARAVAEKEKSRTKVKPQVAPLALPDWLNAQTWGDWVKVRPAKARGMASLQAALEKLEKFRAAGHDANAIVANSLANGWQGLFEPKAGGRGGGQLTLGERNKAAVEEAARRFHEEHDNAKT